MVLDTAVPLASLGSHLGSQAGLGPVIWRFWEGRGQAGLTTSLYHVPGLKLVE